MNIQVDISIEVAHWAVYLWCDEVGDSIRTLSVYKKVLGWYVTKYGLDTLHDEIDTRDFRLEMEVCKRIAQKFHR